MLPWLSEVLLYDLNKNQFYSLCQEPSKWLCTTLAFLGFLEKHLKKNSQKFMFRMFITFVVVTKIECSLYVRCYNHGSAVTCTPRGLLAGSGFEEPWMAWRSVHRIMVHCKGYKAFYIYDLSFKNCTTTLMVFIWVVGWWVTFECIFCT